MSFSVDWLSIREPYDHSARSVRLAQRFVSAVGPGAVLDLAGGTGSGARFLQQHGAGAVTVVDHDPALLEEAARRGHPVHGADLDALAGLDALPSCAGVQAQALIDLVSWDWLDRFVAWVHARRVPLLVALTVDGRVRWSPPDPDDEAVQAAFRAHQALDRGFGPSPGPRAAHELVERLVGRGWAVEQERSDWQVPASDVAMIDAMVRGTAEAAAVTHARPEVVAAWAERRLAAPPALMVGHVDVLALPPQG